MGVLFPAGAGIFSVHHRVHTGSEARPASYTLGTGGKMTGAWSWPLTFI
jgi:hypothetical protein